MQQVIAQKINEEVETSAKSQIKIIISSWGAALISNSIVAPFEVIKIRQQSESAKLEQKKDFNYRSFNQTIKYIVKNEGVGTFFNGITYTLSMTLIANFFRFPIYEASKQLISQQTDKISIISSASSFISNVITTTIVFPLEYWKTKSQAQKGVSNKTPFQLGTNLYVAYILTIQRNLAFWLTFFPISEKIQFQYKQKYFITDNHELPFLINAFSGFIAGACSAIISQPFDVIKTQKQVYEGTYLQTSSLVRMKEMYKIKGLYSLYVGITPRFLNNSIYGTLMIPIYYHIKKTVDKLF